MTTKVPNTEKRKTTDNLSKKEKTIAMIGKWETGRNIQGIAEAEK